MVIEMGRSPKTERRRRSARIAERSLSARAKSMDRFSRRLRELRDVTSSFESWVVEEKEGQRAVIVGLSLKLRFVPLVDRASHLE